MSVTSTSGDEWWIERTDSSGEQRYPISITVGRSFMTGRRYVPERTCRNEGGGDEWFVCSACGHDVVGEVEHIRFCPVCGARVVG